MHASKNVSRNLSRNLSRPRAAQRSRRGVVLLAALGCVLVGCTTAVGQPGERPKTPAPAPPTTQEAAAASPLFAWRCDDGTRLRTRFDAASGRLRLETPDGRRELAPERTASGAAWSGGGERFWNRGEEALWERTASETRCRVDPVATAEIRAAADGAWFRALGNEPGWSLTLYPERMVWVTDYGATRRSFRAPGPETADGGDTVLAGTDPGGTLEVRIEHEPCIDDGDRRWPETVTLGVDGGVLRGCGRYLEDPGA